MKSGSCLGFALILGVLALPVSAQEPAAAAPSVQPAQAVPENPDDKIKCRSMSIIGSLAKKARICRTVREWRIARERGNDAARDITEYSRNKPVSN